MNSRSRKAVTYPLNGDASMASPIPPALAAAPRHQVAPEYENGSRHRPDHQILSRVTVARENRRKAHQNSNPSDVAQLIVVQRTQDKLLFKETGSILRAMRTFAVRMITPNPVERSHGTKKLSPDPPVAGRVPPPEVFY